MGKKDIDKLSQTCRTVKGFGNGKEHKAPIVGPNGDKTTGYRSEKFNGKEMKKNG